MLKNRVASLALALITLCAAAGVALGQNSGEGDRAAERGFTLYREGSYEAALKALDAAIASGVSPKRRDVVHTVRGNALSQLERYDEAIAAHRKALEINPKYHEAWVNLGIVYRRMGNYEQAESSYLKALALAPDYAELHASLGALYIFKNDPDRAARALEKAISLDRQLAVAHANIAVAHAMLGKFDQAESDLRQAIVLGYKQGPVIKERIDALRAAKR